MRLYEFIVLIWCFVNYGNSQETITAGGTISWTIEESVKAPQQLCFTCTVPVQIVSITPAYCSTCFDSWLDNGANCVYYLPGSTTLEYDNAASYMIDVGCNDTGTVVMATINLGVVPNFPPTFDNPSGQREDINYNLKKGQLVKNVTWTDVDDSIMTFSMTENPDNRFFKINNKGEITALKDLNTFCDSETVRVTLTDNHNSPVYFTVIFDPGENTRPVLQDWNKIISFPENKDVKVYITDKLAKPGICFVQSVPEGISNESGDLDLTSCPIGTAYSSFIKITSKQFNYEIDPPLNLTLEYSNYNCPSHPRWLSITWLDVPEKPTLDLIKPEYSANEGSVNVKPDYVIEDEDFNEKHKFSFAATVDTRFDINEDTGKIFTIVGLPATSEVDVYTFSVKVTDKDGLESNSVTVTIRVSDANDHPPVLGNIPASYEADECTNPQKFLTVTASDQDFGRNKEFKFITASAGSLLMNEAGELYLIKPPIPGQKDELTVQAVDFGEPEQYSAKHIVTLYGRECPTTPPPPTPPPPAPPTTPYIPPPTTQPPLTTTVAPPQQKSGASSPALDVCLFVGVLSLLTVLKSTH